MVKARKRRLTTIDEAVLAKRQHTKPCHDCPFLRDSFAGWLGGMPIKEWLAALHSETVIDCHTKKGVNIQCAGAAIYRANVCKLPSHEEILVLPVDRELVFATPMEFIGHHSVNSK